MSGAILPHQPTMQASPHRPHAVVREFKAKLEECTDRAICGRDYVFVAKLTGWMKSMRSGGSTSQAACLLRAAYSRRTSPGLPGETDRLFVGDRKESALLLFAILLELDSADLIHLFLRHDLHKHLPIDLYQLRDKTAKMIDDRNQAELLAKHFNEAQWRYCQATFDLNMGIDFERRRILPICAKQQINNKGGNAELWWIQVPEEFVSKDLQKAIACSRVAPPKWDRKVGHVSPKISTTVVNLISHILRAQN